MVKMHIPDGYLSLQTTLPAIGAMVPIWTIALNKIKKVLNQKQMPLLSLCAAFSFVIMMFNVPVGQSSVHAVGAVFIAILIGPWAACIAVSIALIIQALVFGDGGILAIGINCFNMAFIMPFTGYFIFKIISGKSDMLSKRSMVGIFAGSYFGINLAGLFTAVQFGIQPLLFKAADGTPLYGYYPLSVSIPTMGIEHAIFAGPIEAVITVSAIAYLAKFAPQMLSKASEQLYQDKKSFFSKYKPFIICLGAMVILTPIGLLATGTAWGEWGAKELKDKIGYIPKGFAKFSDIWKAIMPDYSVNGLQSGFFSSSLGYIISAMVGVLLISIVVFITARLLSSEKKGNDKSGN
jgi:cobalt/nickel transport system permease protein